jgi:hypothetical protein
MLKDFKDFKDFSFKVLITSIMHIYKKFNLIYYIIALN